MLSIVWRASARDDLAQIVDYIAHENPVAARNMKRLLEAAILPAAVYPYLQCNRTRKYRKPTKKSFTNNGL